MSSGSKQLGSESEIAFHDPSNIDVHSDSDDSNSAVDDIESELAISEECAPVSSVRLGCGDKKCWIWEFLQMQIFVHS